MEPNGKRGRGRPPGAVSKIHDAARKAAMQSGITPLEYMLNILRDEGQDFTMRFEAAKAAAPYVHARLSSVEQKSEVTVRNVVNMPETKASVSDWQAAVERPH